MASSSFVGNQGLPKITKVVIGIEFHFARIKPEAFCRECRKPIGQEVKCPFCGSDNIEITAGLDTVIQEVS